MKKVLIVLLVIVVILMSYIYLYNNVLAHKIKAVVVQVRDNSMVVVENNSSKGLLIIGFSDEGNIGYKQGQEIAIYYNGIVDSMYPGHIGSPEKIKITKEKSNIEIPEKALRYCYSSRANVDVEIFELTNSGIHLKITDTNELQYNYAHNYQISKEVKNPNYTGVGYKIGEDTANSTAPYIRTWTRIYL